MPQTGDPNPPRWSAEESFLELLTDTLDAMERSSRGQFLQRWFRSIAQIELTEAQSLDFWDQALARKRELTESLGKRVALQAALLDVLASAGQLRLPILMEYEALRKLQINAATDPLTGLYNRRFFEEYFEKELNRSIRYSHKLALVVFDLHRFKDVNDRFGHPQGDMLLQMAAATLRKSLRTSDYAFRIGGDEFALLLPQSDTEQVSVLSRRLRSAYATSIEPLNLRIPLALDYGLAVYPDDGELQEVLIRVADERLYQLKNGTRLAPPPAGPEAASRAPIAESRPLAERPMEPGFTESRFTESRFTEARPAEKWSAESRPRESASFETRRAETGSAETRSGEPRFAEPRLAEPSLGEPRLVEPRPKVTPVPNPSIEPPTGEVKKTGAEARRWERVSLSSTHAYALIGEGVERTARVLDLGYGGVALETSRPEEFSDAFHAVLHVPILPPVRVSLRRVYQKQLSSGVTRIGCSFVT